MSAVCEHAEGATLTVKARPGAKKNAILGEENGAIKISVSAPPEDGRANDALAELLREVLGVRRSQIELLSGKTNKNKVFLIRNLTAAAVSAVLSQVCQNPQNR